MFDRAQGYAKLRRFADSPGWLPCWAWRIKNTFLKTFLPGSVTAIVSGDRWPPLLLAVVQIRYRCPVLSVPAAGFDVAIGRLIRDGVQ